MRIRRTVLLTVSLVTVSALVLAGCAGANGGSAKRLSAAPAAPAAVVPRAAPVADTKCADGQNQVASLNPGTVTADGKALKGSSTMDRIRERGYMTVGTSGDVLLWGATNTTTGNLEGYDVDLLNDVAKAAGYPRIVYKVINYGQRLTALQSGSVDLVAHTMTINCPRWQGTGGQPNAINFSTEYYLAGQKVLVRADSKATKIQDLKGKTVCVPSASTNLIELQRLNGTLKPPIKIVALDVVGDCLVKFQEGEVDAITGDDTVLAGFAAQDPYAVVVGSPFTEEPYGLGINAKDPQFTKFVNAVLEKLRANGGLRALYAKWMLPNVGGSIPPVPAPVYGRVIGKLGRKS